MDSVELKQVDFGEFLTLVPSEELLDDYTKVEYSTINGYTGPAENLGSVEPSMSTALAPVVYGDKLTVLKTSLLHQGNVKRFVLLEAKSDPVESMSVEHAVHFGLPTHLVKLDDNTQMVANPEDFKVIYTDEGAYGLLILAKVRTNIYVR